MKSFYEFCEEMATEEFSASTLDAQLSNELMRQDYKTLLSSLKSLQHPRVKELVRAFVKDTFQIGKGIRGAARRASAMGTADIGGPEDMYSRDDLLRTSKKSYATRSDMTPRQQGGFKGQTTKLRKKNFPPDIRRVA